MPTIEQSTPMLLTAAAAAQLVGVSRATWYALRARNLVPPEVRVRNMPRWRRDDLIAWIELRCPNAEKFAALTGATA